MFHLVMFPHVLLDMGKHLVLMVGCEAAVPTLYRSLGEITVPCTILYKPGYVILNNLKREDLFILNLVPPKH